MPSTRVNPSSSVLDQAIPGSSESASGSSAPAASVDRLGDLEQVIRAYNQVTENLQRTHDDLRRQVARLQEQLASADAQLQRSKRLAALGEMAAGIAHEIRNPLGAIQLYAQMLEKDLNQLAGEAPAGSFTVAGSMNSPGLGEISPVQMAQVAGKIASAVRGLDAVVGDVLSFARDIQPRVQPLAVAEIWERVLQGQRPVLEEAGIKVQCKVEPADLVIQADSELVHQVMLNLIRNAVDALSDTSSSAAAATGGRSTHRAKVRRLKLWARVDADAPRRVLLTVQDNGPGIAQPDIDRIFNPFFTTRATGTGLGLAIVHRIVDAHGGSIVAHNDPQWGGAVFTLNWPGADVQTIAGSNA